jgi:DUF4097 and DUF4098 domain-containing protein YvlB
MLTKEVFVKSKISFLILFVFVVAMAFSFEKTERLSLSADGIDRLVIDCGSGFLYVTGEESLRSIEVEAEIIVRGKREGDMDDYVADNVKLELKRQGSKAVLVSLFKNSFPRINFRERVINLKVTLPGNMNLEVDDGSGELKIEEISGDIRIDDGSGELTVRGIQGDIKIDDGSGTIDIMDVTGSVAIDDGSGKISVNDIGENVEVSDGSGSIYIDGVRGDVIIKDAGSGSVNIHNVKGRVVR